MIAARLAGFKSEYVVFHRSMPFHHRDLSPFMSDIAKIAEAAGAKESHIVVTLRDVPAALNSHGFREDFLPFMSQLEAILHEPKSLSLTHPHATVMYNQHATGGDIAPSRLHVLRLHQMIENPLRELECLNWDVLDVEQLLKSPDLNSAKSSTSAKSEFGNNRAQIVSGKRSAEYLEKLAKNQKWWDKRKHLFPAHARHLDKPLCY